MTHWNHLRLAYRTSEPPDDLDELYFRNAVSVALREAFGIIGMSTPVDILKFDQEAQRAILRVPSE